MPVEKSEDEPPEKEEEEIIDGQLGSI